MTKKEIVWRHILQETLAKRGMRFTQKEIAGRFGYSLSTVNNALTAPRKIGAVEVTGRFFRVRDMEKFFYLWATHRALKRDVIYATHTDDPARTVEANMPPGVIFGAFSAYRLAYKDTPADYSLVYVYARDADAVRKRFPPKKGYENVFVLKQDPQLAAFGQTTPDAQTFVDLWNISEWYAKEYLDALKERMRL